MQVAKFAVPVVVGGGLGALVGWGASETLKVMINDDKTSWIIPVGGALMGIGGGVFVWTLLGKV